MSECILVDNHIYKEYPIRSLLTQSNAFVPSMNAMCTRIEAVNDNSLAVDAK